MRKNAAQATYSVKNVMKVIFGKTISTSNSVVSELIVAMKGMTVVFTNMNIQTPEHAPFVLMNHHLGWDQMV